MSKRVKKLQMDVLGREFQGVSTMLFLGSTGVDAQTDNAMRLGLRKKNIRMQMVKNSLLRRVFADSGVTVPDHVWTGATVVAWGVESVKELSKEIEPHLKDPKLKDKLKVKSVLADGTPTTFEMALKMPTRLEAIGEVIAAAIGPAGQLAACLTAPGGAVASQVAKIAEGAEAAAAS